MQSIAKGKEAFQREVPTRSTVEFQIERTIDFVENPIYETVKSAGLSVGIFLPQRIRYNHIC